MSEEIELKSFHINNSANDKDIEEYHEITAGDITDLPVKKPAKLKEYDFFTQFEVKTGHQKEPRKKSTQKKRRESTLMDLVNSELASVAVPVSENVITMLEDRGREQSSYLLRLPSIQNLFRKSQQLRLDHEYGWGRKERVTLSPIFPRVLENAISDEEYFIPVHYVDPVRLEECKPEDYITIKEDKFLDITISDVKFRYHYLFSLERILCEKLVENYNNYLSTYSDIKNLLIDIRVNRDTKNNVKKELLKISPNKPNDVRFDQTIRLYTGNLIKLKDEYKNCLKKQKGTIHNLISIWSDIETIREKMGYAVTPILLDVEKKDFDDIEFEKEWNDTYNLELSDLLDTIEYDYVTKYLQYKEVKNDKDLESLEKKKISKPKLLIDEEAIKEKVEKYVNSIVTKEHIIVLKKDENIIAHSQVEQDLLKYNYNFDIYVDDVFVCKSENFGFDKKTLFEIDFTESFSVQILPNNKNVSMILIENSEVVAVTNFELDKLNKGADSITLKFVYDNMLIQPTSKYVGNGYNIKEIAKENKVRLKSNNIFVGNLDTTCEITVKTIWHEKLSNDKSVMIESLDVGKKIKRLMHGLKTSNTDMLVDIMAYLYGQEVRSNEKIMQMLLKICKTKIQTELTFPLLDNNSDLMRLKLLYLRNMGGFSSVTHKIVPFHASEISTEQLKCLQSVKEIEVDVEYINDKYTEMNPIDLQRFTGAKYVRRVNENMLKKLHEHLLKKTHKDVVRDYRDLSLRTIFSNTSNLTTLASMPISTRQQYLNDALGKEQEIQITVLRAFNLLDRSSAILTEDDDDEDSTIAGYKVKPLRPFVRLGYNGLSAQTATAIGCHPTWNQTLKIKTKLQPLSCLHIEVFDEYKSNIYEDQSDDETPRSKTVHYRCSNKWLGTLLVPMYTVLTSGSIRGTFKISTPPFLFGYNVLQKKEATYSLIPEVSQMLKKEMSFVCLQITTSLSHLGGLHAYNQPIPSSIDDDDLIKHLNTVVTDYINDFPMRTINLTFIDSSGRNKCVTEFLQPLCLPDYECFPKNPKTRAESAMSKSSGISKSSSSKSSERRKEIDVEKASLSPREKESVYSGFEASWKGESQLVKMMNACLRYVALIPTYDVTESHVVTLIGVELLKVLYGSPLDHTLLLASYFLYLGIKCWVVVGQALAKGHSSFVLTKYDIHNRRDVLVTDQLFKSKRILNKGDGYLWNVYDATSGDKFDLRDVSCPLKIVDYVFDNENIWLNMQASQNCENMSFDLTKSSHWLSVFDMSIFVMKQPLITDSTIYSAPPDVGRLRETLESKIKTKVQKWRPQQKTIWNRYCSTLLREVLPHWEYWTYNPMEPKPALNQRLKQLMITYKLFGFPLNMPYVNAKAVVSSVKSTGIHLMDDPNVEYGLAVEVYAYPNNVLSVWVFFVSITRI